MPKIENKYSISEELKERSYKFTLEILKLARLLGSKGKEEFLVI